MKIAVVRNRKNEGVVCRFGRPSPEIYGRKSVQRVMDALRAEGHEVKAIEGDGKMVSALQRFMPPDSGGRPTGLVFNMSYGIQGDSRYTHTPSILEMAGVPYTGSTPFGHTLCLDKVVTKILMRDAGIPTPAWRVMERPSADASGMEFPLIVKPRHESTSFGLELVHDGAALHRAVEAILDIYQQSALVEQYIPGREVNISLLGNKLPQVLPIVELDFGGRATQLDTWDDKYHKADDEPQKCCPADLADALTDELRDLAIRLFESAYCRDYARIDVRIAPDGRPYVLEINSMASLGAGGSYVLAASHAGLDFQGLVARIVDTAHERYFGIPAPRGLASDPATANGGVDAFALATRKPTPQVHQGPLRGRTQRPWKAPAAGTRAPENQNTRLQK